MTRILDPTLRTASLRPAGLAPRLSSLTGATIGLLANGKSNGMALLDRLADHLREHHGVAGVVRVAKTNASVPVSVEDGERLAQRATVVLTAIGD